MQKDTPGNLKKSCCFSLLFFITAITHAQQSAGATANTQLQTTKPEKSLLHAVAGNDADLFGTRTKYIENIGQYGDTLAGFGKMGKILFGYEGAGMPVLFTSKGIIHLQRKTNPVSYEEREEQEEKGLKLKDDQFQNDQVITMDWVNGNSNPRIVTEGVSKAYFTYSLLKGKAKGYKKVTYKEIYPGVDLVYSFIETTKAGFEFSLVVRPGADISKIKMRYGGDVKNIAADKAGNLIIRSVIDEIEVSMPVFYYAGNKEQKINASFSINENEIGFKLPENYHTTKTLIIDPFVSPVNLSGGIGGVNDGKATDIDFDYDGNIYISGGGDNFSHNLVKFDKNGILQWTFNGSVSIINWSFGPSHGGWVVEKTTGNIYLGQGLAGGGFRVIRLNAAGVYDNYITTANSNFAENWKMLWSCNGGVPKILIAGGGGSANNELAILTPPGLVPATSNISGLSGGHNDISDIIIDPVSNDMFTIFSVSVLAPNTNSKIYKHTAPYAPANIAWIANSGYSSVREPNNRPYISTDNSSNTIAVNSDYVFYWDGKNLKAFNKATGNAAGTPVTLPNIEMMQGGIFADECNNVFVGSTNGTIKVYTFDGAVFNDAAAADITITGFSTKSVYDITYDHASNLIYTCGDGFVASIDVSKYCAAPVYSLTVVPDSINLTATISLTPAAAAGSTVSFSLFDGSLLISSNTTGIFTGLSIGITYTVKAFINQACGGTQVTKDFTLNQAPVLGTISAIYVPNAFTPNTNGINDLLKIILYGMRELHYFSIYNRYGELVFTTKDPAIGWDGKFKGKMQNTGAFAWIAEAVDQNGNIIRKKGTSIMIR